MLDTKHYNSKGGDLRRIVAAHGCKLLASLDPVERQAAEGRRVCKDTSLEAQKRQIEEERRRTTKDKLQRFILEAKAIYRNGGFGLSREYACLERILDLPKNKAEFDVSGMNLSEPLVACLEEYLATPDCPVLSINVAKTRLLPSHVIRIAKACNPSRVQTFQASGIKVFVPMMHSKEVVLAKSHCDHLDVSVVAAFLDARKKNIVTLLDVSENELTGKETCKNMFGGIEALANAFVHCRSLTHLKLNNVHLHSEGTLYIAKGLQHALALTHIELSHNAMCMNVTNQTSYSGFEGLCEALRLSHTITHLILSKNDLDYNCAKYLSDTLRVNDSLVYLDISQNGLGSVGVGCIARALQANPPLTFLDISRTQMSSKAANGLAEALERNSTLTSLTILDNPDFQERGYRRLISAMEANATVAVIQMTIDDDDSRQAKETQVKLRELCEANHALKAVKNALGTFDFGALPPFAQVSFVQKLNTFTEAELCTLLTNQTFVRARMSPERLTALRYFSNMQLYTPLKRLIWAYDALARAASRANRTSSIDEEAALWQDTSLVELPPLRM